MADSPKSNLTRRTFLKGAGVATAAAVGPTIIVRSARAKSDTLKIGQWTHFVPAFDEFLIRSSPRLAFARELTERPGVLGIGNCPGLGTEIPDIPVVDAPARVLLSSIPLVENNSRI